MEYVYTALGWTASLGGYVWCLYSVAFRWHTVTHKYGRLDLWLWLSYVGVVTWALSAVAIIAVYEVEVALGRYG